MKKTLRQLRPDAQGDTTTQSLEKNTNSRKDMSFSKPKEGSHKCNLKSLDQSYDQNRKKRSWRSNENNETKTSTSKSKPWLSQEDTLSLNDTVAHVSKKRKLSDKLGNKPTNIDSRRRKSNNFSSMRGKLFDTRIEQIQKQINAIRDGSHPLMRSKIKQFQALKDKQCKVIEMRRKFHVSTTNEIYEHDLKGIKENHLERIEQLKETMVQEISSKIKKIENLRDGIHEEKRMHTRNLRSKMRLDDLPEIAPPTPPTLVFINPRSRKRAMFSVFLKHSLLEDEINDDIKMIKRA
mmetsp:Transcript_25552/g.33414  ORF Transcript_25552/g.33414 Transcript_25552/m.33414 type:complete len:293 (+) Transcript_25552:66-944(+)|eukprot:CAMPEP_0117747944 /NCGR_PEP_ID=MMETSP0947-20121206/8796_1 /TAXON_ID=44440 /ORGANISM="Chattonella subsalsa, Strain CCMP2191" /LENGTH=292 /DNA_ID=CAMNT_0005565461 /DNA_START=46 /DNA_END=924 /DNA_ORIENTATION=+